MAISGAIIAMLAAPPIAIAYGWRIAYLAGAGLMLPALLVMFFLAKEPPDRITEKFTHHLKVFGEKDAGVFNVSYILTFGGYIGLTIVLPAFLLYDSLLARAPMGKCSGFIAIMASIS